MYRRDHVFCLTFLALNVVGGSAAGQSGPVALRPGHWIGGIGSLDDATLSWSSAGVELAREGDELTGRLRTDDGRGFWIRISGRADRVTAVLERKAERRFAGRAGQDIVVLSSDDGNTPNRLILRRIESLSPQTLDALAGVYVTGAGRKISFRRLGQLLSMTDFSQGHTRFLYPVAQDRFVAGPSIAVPDPVTMEFQFASEGDPNSRTVTIDRSGEPTVKADRPAPRQIEDFEFESFDGTRMVGSLYLPPGDRPVPAFVWVHGSGPATRDRAGSWPWYFSELGFAVLAVDKRGVGESSGEYRLPDGGRDNFPHMRRRSKDVAAAVRALRKRADIDKDQIGLVGASQAGWVIPMATQHVDVQFAIILYGGATPLSVEGRYSRMASENKSGAQLKPVADLVQQLRSYQPDDVGIDRELAGMRFPCLWLYGFKDRSNPSQICVDRIDSVAKANDLNFSVQVFPDGNHGLLECRYGGAAESLTLDRVVPGLYESIEKWLSDNGILPES